MQQQPVFKTITTLFFALLFGQVSFAVIAYFLVSTGRVDAGLQDIEKIFTMLVPVLIISGLLVGKLVYDKKIQAAQGNKTATEKLESYRSAVIVRCALLEGPVLFAIISYLLTGKDMLLLFAIGGILLFLLLKPTKAKAASELQLSEAEF